MTAADAAAVLRIYGEGIATGDATFETDIPTWESWDAGHLPLHRFVAVDDGHAVLGWVAVSAVSGRCVYAGVVECSVYVAAAARGGGAGSKLLAALIASTEAAGIWTIQAGIFPENLPSIRIHEQVGFRSVGTQRRLGRMADGTWRDVLLLEYRSPTI